MKNCNATPRAILVIAICTTGVEPARVHDTNWRMSVVLQTWNCRLPWTKPVRHAMFLPVNATSMSYIATMNWQLQTAMNNNGLKFQTACRLSEGWAMNVKLHPCSWAAPLLLYMYNIQYCTPTCTQLYHILLLLNLVYEVRHFTVTIYLSVFPAAFHQVSYMWFTVVRNGWMLQ